MRRNGLRPTPHAFARLAGVTLAALGARAAAQDLQGDLARLHENSEANGATVSWCVVAVDGDPGEPGPALASHAPTRALIPASNMKLVTSGAALQVLGPDYVFRTEIGLAGETLVVKGAGDPALADPVLLEQLDPPMTLDAMLDVLARAVADAGVEEADELVVDDRVFDRELIHDDWPRDQLDKQYCAQVSGLNFHTNILRVFVAPGSAGVGTAADVSTQPSAGWLSLDNRTRTAASGTNTIWPTRAQGTNDFTVHGQVVRKGYFPLEVTVHEPARLFGDLLADHVRAAGVAVDGPVRLASETDSLELDRVLARVTTDIADALARCNEDSRNLYAESFIKLIGHRVTGEPGSWTNGATVVRMLIGEILGPQAAAGVVISDGSGMSRENRLSPQLICRWLEAMAEDERVADIYVASLAEPGNGTLRKRFLGTGRTSALTHDLHAKSGYLNGVRALSGYVGDPRTGPALAFSFLVNDISTPAQDRAARTLIDDAVEEIDRYLSMTATANVPGD